VPDVRCFWQIKACRFCRSKENKIVVQAVALQGFVAASFLSVIDRKIDKLRHKVCRFSLALLLSCGNVL